ncbi:MAG: universal stress protein [Bacteroidetes bacterium]|jgi:nucleotide-binding universal stress UspA family protein|nr:universal stress protein [Bacteroidota bacterium]
MNDQDASLVRYAGLVSRMAQSEHVWFVHVYRTQSLVEDLYSNLVSMSAASRLQEDLEAFVEAHFDGPEGVEVHCSVVQGTPLLELLRLARSREADIVLVGKDRSSGTLAEKMARKAPCSVLIVPPGTTPEIDQILVPLDFSDHAEDAIDVALAFGKAAGGAHLRCLHVYDVPTGYYKAGKSHDEFAALVRDRAEAQYCQFLQRLHLRDDVATPVFQQDRNVPRTIRRAVDRYGSDLVVMGTRGRTDSAAVLMGSVTEKIIRTTQVPVVAVKKKGATLSFLEALLDL